MPITKSSKSPKNGTTTPKQYPVPAYLNFTPGGIICSHGEDTDAHKYNLSQTSDPSPIIQRAVKADTELHRYALHTATHHALTANTSSDSPATCSTEPLPYRTPSLSALAEATFGALTGVPEHRARLWADAMVLSYYRAHQRVESLSNPVPPQLRLRKGEDVAALLARLKTAAQEQPLGAGSDRLNRPCGYIFRRGDMAWNCRTCQTDTTCVLCDTCFRSSDHTGHDVFFHQTTPGGCCDCGDAEAWKPQGCCPRHRPAALPEESETKDGENGTEDTFDDFEAVKASLKGRNDGEYMLKDDDLLTSPFKAALGAVIGAAVQCLVKAVDGAGISNDAVQWKTRWAEQLSRVAAGNVHEEEEPLSSSETDGSFIENVLYSDEHFPSGFKLNLRLHNDDVHTFEEVINALHQQDMAHVQDFNNNHNDFVQRRSLVPSREEAERKTHHVDADGQVSVKTYTSFKEAMKGFKRLRKNGLHCAVISSAQEDLENRAKVLSGWLKDVAHAHPAAAALVAHALCDVTGGRDIFGGVSVCLEPRMIPCWSGTSTSIQTTDEQKMLRMKAFPPHLASSYLTREEGRELHKAMKLHMDSDNLFTMTGSSPNFYDRARFMSLPSERLRKSPHALWGTLETPPSQDQITHPLLDQTKSNNNSFHLRPNLYLIDTDLRKQQETEKLTSSLYPHDLVGLNLISGICLSNSTTLNLDQLLDATSFRAPLSALLLILLLDPYPPKLVRGSIHQLFLSLLVDSRFRSRFAAAFGGVAYRPLSTLFCAGCGTEADTPLGFTVQVFTTGSLVRALGSIEATRKLLEYDGSDASVIKSCSSNITTFTIPLPLTVVRAVHSNLLGSTKEVSMIASIASPRNLTYQQGEHPIITLIPAASDDGFLDSRLTKHKRIPHLLRDLEYIFETPGTALGLLLPNKYTLSKIPFMHHPLEGNPIKFVQAWARLLRLAQGMDSQKRRTSGGHVEYENARWYEAFGLSINFAGMRDALAESPLGMTCTKNHEFDTMKGAVGNLLTAVLQEIKYWLYQEQLLSSGLPAPGSTHDSNQLEVLQRSTLHVSSSHVAYANQALSLQPQSQIETRSNKKSQFTTVGISCATGVKISEHTLDLFELALKKDEEEVRHPDMTQGAIMGDWLRVPHSPLMGNLLSFHLPLHRALAKTIKSLFSVSVSKEIRDQNPRGWWKIPIVDAEDMQIKNESDKHSIRNHTLVQLLRPTIGIRNCHVTWNGGPDCTPAEAHSRRMRKYAVSSAIASAKVMHSLCDHPLRCLAASQQIDRHLWARNGNSAAGMALNYGSSPLCNSFRDLDLTLVQLSISGFSVGLGARRSFGLLMSRFNLDGYLSDPVRKESSINAAGIEHENWTIPPLLPDHDCALAMAEAFFSTLCMLVTELPPPPPFSKDDDSIMKMSMRRELLHALATEPKSYSEALSAASFGTSLREENSIVRNVFSDVLRSIAVEKRAQAQVSRAAPPTYELKAECSDEYDPSFYHLRRMEHQHAMDRVARLRKQKSKSKENNMCLPLVTSPPSAHLRFAPCRLILHLSSMDAAVRRVLLFALTGGSWLPPAKPTPPESNDVSISLVPSDDNSKSVGMIRNTQHMRRGLSRKVSFAKKAKKKPPFSPSVVAASSVSFLEVLQILTIQIHTLTECSSLHRIQNLDEESHNLSSGISMNSYLTRLIFVPGSLENCWALGCPEPLSSSGSGLKRGSILGLLIALYEHRNENDVAPGSVGNDDDGGGARSLVSEGLKWMLRFVSLVVGGTMSIENARECATNGTRVLENFESKEQNHFDLSVDSSVKDIIEGMIDNLPNLWPKKKDASTSLSSMSSSDKNREARKAAQKRLLEKMRQRQANFAKSIANAEEGENKKPNCCFPGMAEEEEDLCIICRCDDADGESNGPLGYLGHVQRSKVLQLRGMCELSQGDELHSTARVVGSKGCQLRAGEEMNSSPIACIPQGSLVTILKSKISSNYDLLSRRVFVRFDPSKSKTSSNFATSMEGWASVESSQGYKILAPLKELGFNNTRWGSTRPIIRQCGHAAHAGCVERHCLSLHQRSASDQPFDGRFAANVDEGEFLCPLCKQLSNILVPKGWNVDNPQTGDKDDVDNELLNLTTVDSVGAEGIPKLKRLLVSGMDNSIPQEVRSSHESSLVEKKNYSEMKAMKEFGENLSIAMKPPWNNTDHNGNDWLPFLTKWDYEDSQREEITEDGSQSDQIGNILRLLRQQHIAWSSVGYCAASAEASSREDESISDPWAGYTTSRDSHPMLLDLRRTLTATSSLLGMLNYEMEKNLQQNNDGKSGTPKILGELLGDILDGGNFDSNTEEWSAILSYISSQPCHVARDGMLNNRNEARATAASMWAVKGSGSNRLSTETKPTLYELTLNPSVPLAVDKMSASAALKNGWGTNNPSLSSKEGLFRPTIASAFLHVPLLAWDLNTLSSAILSSLLLNKIPILRYEDLLLTAQTLLLGRLVQILITPNGYFQSENNVGSTSKRSKKDEQSESRNLAHLHSYCKGYIDGLGSNNTSVNSSEDENQRLLANVSRAILPFSRSLVLLLRACSSILRQKNRLQNPMKNSSMDKPSPAEKIFNAVLEDSEMLCIDDGLHIFRVMGGPMLSDLLTEPKEDSTLSWKKLIDRWLHAVVSLESFHGSQGKGAPFDPLSQKQIPSYVNMYEQNLDTVDSIVVEENGHDGVEVTSVSQSQNEPLDDFKVQALQTNENNSTYDMDAEYMYHVDDDIGSDDEMEDVDEGMITLNDDESMDYDDTGFNGPDSMYRHDAIDEFSQHSDSSESQFAHVSTSAVIPYQPSLLRKQRIGPGPTGINFDFARASNIVHDMSHFGMIHCPDTTRTGLIRLPLSFVELYSIVNKVKRRDLINSDEYDDSSASEIAICLLTGSIMRSGSARRAHLRAHKRPVGPCTLHARKIGSGVGIFFLVQKCTVLLMHNNKSAYSASLYVDDHGEEDTGLRRGRPLFLKEVRYQALETLWRQHGIPREVSQIRSTSDRVIRDNWY